MPLEELALFLRFGYISNQLSLPQKLLNFSTNEQPPDDLRGVCAGAQTQILLRLFVGAVAELWKLVEERIVKSSLRKAEVDTFDEGGKSALDDEMRATKAIQITDAPHIDDVRLPFFVEVSESPSPPPTPPSRSTTS